MSRNYFVFRIDYGATHNDLVEEIRQGRLRQGWGAEGMTLGQSAEDFNKAWRKAWPNPTTKDEYILRKYRNIQIMTEMKPGDIIIVPKVNLNDISKWGFFTIVEVTEKYTFELFGDTGDFGHTIGVNPRLSCSYSHNEHSEDIVAKFRAYQRSITRVFNRKVIDGVENLLSEYERDPDSFNSEDQSTLASIASSTRSKREEYMVQIVDALVDWKPDKLEKATKQLFEKHGYTCIARNKYDGEGADVDLVFASYPQDSLMGSILDMSGSDNAEIRLQLKSKKGQDLRDTDGVKQLLSSSGSRDAINILINLTSEFSAEAIKLAKENGIILLNGPQFASLLIRYGLDSSLI